MHGLIFIRKERMTEMFIEGGIYNDNDDKATCFIVLKLTGLKNQIFGVDIAHLQLDEFSNKSIHKRLQILKDKKMINGEESNSYLWFWSIQNEATLLNQTDGYIGQINDKVLKELQQELYKSATWKNWWNI